MPLSKELSFKSGARYAVGQAFADSYTSTERQQLRQHLIGPDIFVSKSVAFSTKYLHIYDKYVLPATERNIDVANHWHNTPMDFWQTQLNFTTWCATAGCGVSVQDRINGRYDFAPESAQLSKSIFRFHVYYQTRRILRQLSAALPTNKSWNAFSNTYNHTAYQTICNEFGWIHKKATGGRIGGRCGGLEDRARYLLVLVPNYRVIYRPVRFRSRKWLCI